MKNLWLPCLLLTSSSMAQLPTLTQANMDPTLGLSFEYSMFMWTHVPPAVGASATWNFTSPGATVATNTGTYQTPGSCPGSASYPGATMALNFDSDSYEFYSYSSTLLLHHGYDNGPGVTTIVYSDPEKKFSFPFSYGNGFTDSYSGGWTDGAEVWTRGGEVIVDATGIGTLNLPSATITDVLLIESTQVWSDSVDGVLDHEYSQENYMFYKPGFPTPLLRLHYMEVDGSPGLTWGQYIDDSALEINDQNQPNDFNVFPNPASDELFILAGEEFKNATVEIYNLSGELILSQVNDQNFIDIRELTQGMYLIRVHGENSQLVRKFVKK